MGAELTIDERTEAESQKDVFDRAMAKANEAREEDGGDIDDEDADDTPSGDEEISATAEDETPAGDPPQTDETPGEPAGDDKVDKLAQQEARDGA